MRFRSIIFLAIVATMLAAITIAADDIYELLAETPHDAGALFICADFPEFREKLRDIGLGEIIIKLLSLLHEDPAELYQAISGRLLVAYNFPDDNFFIVMDVDPDSVIAQRFGQADALMEFQVVQDVDGVARLIAPDWFALFMRYENGSLRISPRRELVVDPRVVPGPKITELLSFARLIEIFDIEKGMVVIIPDEQNLPEENVLPLPHIPYKRREPRHVGDELLQTVSRFFVAFSGRDRYIAGGARLEIANSISMEFLTVIEDFQPPADVGATLNLPAWEATPVHVAAGRSQMIKWIIPALRRGFAAADQDILDEFDEEMADVNEELGFEFERDFIGNLTGDWSLSVWGDSQWAFHFQVGDPEAFLRHARAMAELSDEPWETDEAAPVGTTAITTRAYNIPLRLYVAGNEVNLLTGELQTPMEPEDATAREDDGEVDFIRLRYNFAGQLEFHEITGGPADFLINSALEEVPSNAAIALTVRDGEGYRRSTVAIENLDRDDLRKIFGGVKRIIDALM